LDELSEGARFSGRSSARREHGRHWVGEAIMATKSSKEAWFEVEVNRVAGEIALKSPDDLREAKALLDELAA
jgi:hypothetical protein